ncbi:MAG: histidine kinase [Anaerolineae bacterium]|nr:histidine kinase [Anaerolineae bacterium]
MTAERPWHHPNLTSRVGFSEAGLVFTCTLAAQLIVGTGAIGGAPPGHAILISASAAVVTGIVAAWAARVRQRRLNRLLNVSEAWLRGNLALRANESGRDEIGLLARQLNLLTEHLEEDEQDLERLHESNTRLTDQVRALAVVEERNRLARELHDSVKQHLFSLAMTAGAVRTHYQLLEQAGKPVPPELVEMVQEIETAAQTAQRETTRLIEDLRPDPLQKRGLVAALNDFTLIFGARHHLLVYFDVQCNDQWLPPVVTEALYRVTQEALHNVGRHARATRVDMQLSCSEHRVTLTIEDNGVGFDTGRTRKGLGISSMQERLITNGGRLTVESHPGTGTTVRAEIDVAPRSTNDTKGLAADGVTRGQTVEEPQHVPSSGHPARREAAAQAAGGTKIQPQAPRPEAWAWLGQRLVIPVGQMWPWLPIDQAHYLQEPVAQQGNHVLKREHRLLGLRATYALRSADGASTLVRIVPERTGYRWDLAGADWTLRRVRGLKGRAVLERKGQALAALQYRGRQMDTWTEIVYDDRSYRLLYGDSESEDFILLDASGGTALVATQVLREPGVPRGTDAQVSLAWALPLPLVAIAIARILDEAEMKEVTEAG